MLKRFLERLGILKSDFRKSLEYYVAHERRIKLEHKLDINDYHYPNMYGVVNDDGSFTTLGKEIDRLWSKRNLGVFEVTNSTNVMSFDAAWRKLRIEVLTREPYEREVALAVTSSPLDTPKHD